MERWGRPHTFRSRSPPLQVDLPPFAVISLISHSLLHLQSLPTIQFFIFFFPIFSSFTWTAFFFFFLASPHNSPSVLSASPLLLLLLPLHRSARASHWATRLMMFQKLWPCLVFYYQSWTAWASWYLFFIQPYPRTTSLPGLPFGFS